MSQIADAFGFAGRGERGDVEGAILFGEPYGGLYALAVLSEGFQAHVLRFVKFA
jgi:hypothetical protein